MRALPAVTLGLAVLVLGGCSGDSVAEIAADPAGGATASGAPTASSSADDPMSPAVSQTHRPPPRSASPSPRSSAQAAPAQFGTVRPGELLPTGSQCATWVRARPMTENKGVNARANRTTGHAVDGSLFSGDTAAAARVIAPRIGGRFTGTTQEILRWAACKWGIDENIVYAQAAIESWWRMDTLGDWGTDAAACAPGHELGADGRPGECPQSFGVMQDRWPYTKQGWPGYGRSTAMNVDIAYGIWRACYEGYETWLNTVERGQDYGAGDSWGCIGRWFSGRWHTAAGEEYVGRVRDYLAQRIWRTPDFQQP